MRTGLDRLIQTALEENIRIDVVNYPDGRHSFDALDDNDVRAA